MDVLGSPTISVDPPLEQQAGETYPPETTTRITAAVICHDEKVTGSIVRPQGEWDPRLRVTTVESGEDRDIATTHEGREGRVTPQSPTTPSMVLHCGTWTFSSPLRNGEGCDGSPAPLNLLNVSAQVTCRN
jgi:hypothetical protein